MPYGSSLTRTGEVMNEVIHFRYWPDPEVPTASPAGPLTAVDLPCQRGEWHGSF